MHIFPKPKMLISTFRSSNFYFFVFWDMRFRVRCKSQVTHTPRWCHHWRTYFLPTIHNHVNKAVARKNACIFWRCIKRAVARKLVSNNGLRTIWTNNAAWFCSRPENARYVFFSDSFKNPDAHFSKTENVGSYFQKFYILRYEISSKM